MSLMITDRGTMQVQVQSPEQGWGVENHHFTQLFRDDSRLPFALNTMLDRIDADEPRIISAGCSFGAEADTMLAQLNKAGERPVELVGYDCNPSVVQVAQAGRYLAGAYTMPEMQGARMTLKAHGFDVGRVRKAEPDSKLSFLAPVDSARVRRPHQVRFMELDLARGVGATGDLVVANNVLIYPAPEVATAIAHNLATMVRPGGVLSIRDTKWALFMECNQRFEKKYSDWLKETGEMFRRCYGMRAVAHTVVHAPVVFVKD